MIIKIRIKKLLNKILLPRNRRKHTILNRGKITIEAIKAVPSRHHTTIHTTNRLIIRFRRRHTPRIQKLTNTRMKKPVRVQLIHRLHKIRNHLRRITVLQQIRRERILSGTVRITLLSVHLPNLLIRRRCTIIRVLQHRHLQHLKHDVRKLLRRRRVKILTPGDLTHLLQRLITNLLILRLESRNILRVNEPTVKLRIP